MWGKEKEAPNSNVCLRQILSLSLVSEGDERSLNDRIKAKFIRANVAERYQWC